MAGRGRGRGALLMKNLQQLRKPGDSVKDGKGDSVAESLETLLEAMKINNNDYIDKIVQQVKTSVTSDDKIQSFAKSLHKCVTRHPKYATTGATICDKITKLDIGQKFRAHILRLIQTDYKNKTSVKNESVERFAGSVGFLCAILRTLRVGGKPLLPLVPAVYECLDFMLQDQATDLELTLLYNELIAVGDLLQTTNPDRMQDLMNMIRVKIINESTTEKARCQLMELIEIRANQWKPLPAEDTKLYTETMQDIMQHMPQPPNGYT